MPLNNTSVNYLLNNIYDLTTNDGTKLEKDSNSFNSWSANNVNIWSSKNAAFEKNKSNCSISKSSFTGEKILKLKATQQTSFNIQLLNSENSVYNNSVTINTNETIIDFSTYTFDTIIISKDMSNINNNIGLELTDPFDSAASNVTSATLTFTQVQYNSEFDAAIAVAQQRGWTIQFAS